MPFQETSRTPSFGGWGVSCSSEPLRVGWRCCRTGASSREPRTWADLASAAVGLTYLFGRLVGDLLLGWRSGEESRPRPSALLCEHEDTPRRPLGVGPVHVPPTGRKLLLI